LEDVFGLEVNVRDDRDLALLGDDVQHVGVVLGGDGDTHDVATGRCELGDLLKGAVDIRRLGRRHRLNRNLVVAADHHLSHLDLAGLATRCERLDDAGKSDVYSHSNIVQP
jgi:hypothetical protein